jgi:hypothetical protein
MLAAKHGLSDASLPKFPLHWNPTKLPSRRLLDLVVGTCEASPVLVGSQTPKLTPHTHVRTKTSRGSYLSTSNNCKSTEVTAKLCLGTRTS